MAEQALAYDNGVRANAAAALVLAEHATLTGDVAYDAWLLLVAEPNQADVVRLAAGLATHTERAVIRQPDNITLVIDA